MIKEALLRKNVTQNEIIVGVCALVLTVIIIAIVKKVRSKFPPGPVGLPIVGYLPFLTDKPHLKFIKLSKKYGDIFSISLGSMPVVILNSAEVIREALLNPDLLGRPPYGPFALFKTQSPFFTSPVHVWQEQRRFVVHSMKDLGLGKSKIEEHIKDEISAFLEVLKSHNGKPMDIKVPLTPSMSNNICALVFGKRYSPEDPERKLLDKSLDDFSEFLSQAGLLLLFPWIRHIPFMKSEGYKRALNAVNVTQDLYGKLIKQHIETLDPQNIRDYVDSYLVQMKLKKEKDPNTTFNDQTLVTSAGDLFGAGSETVRTSILWCIYTVAAYPDQQKRIQKEILDVIGPDRMAEFLDQRLMPYTHAFILEILRWITILPLNLLHYSTADTTVGGYKIPKNTCIMANFWAAHHDPKHWSDPGTFKPERFLAPDGKTIIKPPNYMPFSVGRRVCPGETMAYMEIFLYFVSILQKFDVVFPNNEKPSFDFMLSLTKRPIPYEVRFISKSHS